MYRYDAIDRALVDERVAQYRDQVRRFLAGELTEDEFRPLRLQNGLYIQRHAPMLRVAIPYGLLSTAQMRMLAHIARELRPRLRAFHDAPEHPVQLAEAGGGARHPRRARRGGDARDPDQRQLRAQHHIGRVRRRRARRDRRSARALPRSCASGRPSIRSSASCRASSRSRSTAPRRTAPPLRCTTSACTCVHATERAKSGLRVLVGGGMGRTPIVGQRDPRVPAVAAHADLRRAILRVYNRYGRRDNIYKARIKILVKALGADGVRAPGRSRVGRS